MSNDISNSHDLLPEIVNLINKAHLNVAVAVNVELTILYWNIGKRISSEILCHKRAEYGAEIIKPC